MNQQQKLAGILFLAVLAGAVYVAQNQVGGSEKLRVLILYESGDLTPAVANVIASPKIKAYLETHGAEGLNYLALDKDTSLADLPAAWQDMGKQRPKEVPAIVIQAGKKGYAGTLPDTADAVITLLQKYGGK